MVDRSRSSRTCALILDIVKRTYNVDENRVVLSGVSDGGTATYYFSMRDTTPFAGFLPLNGAMAVLATRRCGVDGELFPNNMREQAVLHRERRKDPLYPTTLVEPYIQQMQKGGVEVEVPAAAGGRSQHGVVARGEGHLRAFVSEHPRSRYPTR